MGWCLRRQYDDDCSRSDSPFEPLLVRRTPVHRDGELRLNTHIECPDWVPRERIWPCLHPEGPVGLGAESQKQDAILASQFSLTREPPSSDWRLFPRR
jgi:hypothetical protein